MCPREIKITLDAREANQFLATLERMNRKERWLLWLMIGRHSLLVFLGSLLGAVAGVLIGGSL